MFVLAAVLTASIGINIDLSGLIAGARKAEPEVTCGIHTVGYRFVGTPGQEFRYAGDSYTIPSEGSVELIADRRRTTYAIHGHSLPLDVWPRDQFGFREVPLPKPIADATTTITTAVEKGDSK
jgi:hypothetical protein